MVILFTTFQGGIAGSSYSVLDLARGLKQRGHQIHFAGKREMPLFTWMTDSGIQCHNIRFSGYLDIQSARQLNQLVALHGVQILNAQSGIDRTISIWGKLFLGNQVKLVFTRRQQPIDEPWIKRVLHMKSADAIVCTSRAIFGDLVEKGYDPGCLTIIQNGILSRAQDDSSEEFRKDFFSRYSIDGPVIGCVSRKKRQDLLLKAISELPENWNYLFVGVEENDFKIPAAMKKRVHFTGRVQREMALKYYSVMDVNLLLTDAEGFGMTVLESMQIGVPIIASNVGGIRELIRDRENGFLVENTSESIRMTLLEAVPDMGNNKAVIQNGYDTYSTYSLESTIDQYETFFLSLLL